MAIDCLCKFYSKQILPRTFGFGMNPKLDFDAVKPIFDKYEIFYYQDNTPNTLFIRDWKFKGRAFFSVGVLDVEEVEEFEYDGDWVIADWVDLWDVSGDVDAQQRLEKRMKKYGDTLAWLRYNEPVVVLSIERYGVICQK